VAKLIVNPTSSSRREIALARSLVSIGRDPSNDVVLPDAMVSRRHAVIEFRGSQYFLRDCNSSNGSLVNGDRVSERNLRDGDLVAIGTARMLFREELEGEDVAGKVVQHPSAPRLHCPQCQADYRKGDQFCRQCGHNVAPAQPAKAVCASCGTVVPLPAKFCNACGKELPPGSAGAAATEPEPAPEIEIAKPAPDASREDFPLTTEPSAGRREPPPSESKVLESPAIVRLVPEPPPMPKPALSPSAPMARAAAAAAIAPPPPRRDPHASHLPPRRASSAPASPPPRPMAVGPTGTASLAGVSGIDAPVLPRLVAGLIDVAIVGAVQTALMLPVLRHWWARELPATPNDVPYLPILLSLGAVPLIIVLGGAYYALFWGLKGATPGKQMLGLAVAAEDGTIPIGLSRATLRVLGYAASAALLGIGFLMIAFGGTSLHDRMAGTRVVTRGK
jgi:uncharacterized RDD family membrane protein YckC